MRLQERLAKRFGCIQGSSDTRSLYTFTQICSTREQSSLILRKYTSSFDWPKGKQETNACSNCVTLFVPEKVLLSMYVQH